MANKRNVIVGAAELFLGPSGTTAPALVAGTSYRTTLGPGTTDADTETPAVTDPGTGTDPAAWDNVGFTQEGLEVSNEPDFGEVEVDQLLDSARTFKQSMRFSVNTTLAEATLKNLRIAWGQRDNTVTGDAGTDAGATFNIEGGSLGEAPLERGLIAVGNGPETAAGAYSERTYHLYRVLSVEASAHALRRNEATVFPVSFRCLPADNGRYGTIRDRVVGGA